MIEIYAKNVGDIWLGVAFQDEWILATTFAKQQQTALANLLEIIPYNEAFEVVTVSSAFAKKAIEIVKDAYEGKNLAHDLPLAYERLPAYTSKVLKTVFAIPAGYVSSYGLVAKAAGGGARAVGNVMASNPFAPIVPCHRVVTSDFRLGGYGSGLAVKFEFLKRECKGYSEPKTIHINGQKLQLFPAETVFSKLQKKFTNVFATNPYIQ